jgi:hypothetical protein
VRRHEEQIISILAEAADPLYLSDITNKLNGRTGAPTPFTTIQVMMALTELAPQLEQDGQGRWMLKRRGSQ